MLADIFKQKYPLLLRIKTFFQLQQQSGQDERAFVEHLKATAAKADIQGMNLEDALCLVTISGLKDSWANWRTRPCQLFKVLTDAHMHTKATAGGAATDVEVLLVAVEDDAAGLRGLDVVEQSSW